MKYNQEDIAEYLIKYLNNDENKKKVIAFSAKWGSGKSYIWDFFIKKKLKAKNIIYISLYGKNSIKDIEKDLYLKAITDNNDELGSIMDYIPKFSSIFGKGISSISDSLSFDILKYKARGKLQDSSVICFDDFERKSENINLNTLFGIIYNLSNDLNVTSIIIMNSDEYSKEDLKIFNKTKEKIISKYINFTPSSTDLFNGIIKKYTNTNILINKKYILSILNLIKIVNGRDYQLVLNNLNEWFENKADYSELTIKTIILGTLNYSQNAILLKHIDLKNIKKDNNYKDIHYYDVNLNYFPDDLIYDIDTVCSKFSNEIKDIDFIILEILNERKNLQYKDILEEKKNILNSIYLYTYFCEYGKGLDTKIKEDINYFIKTGIILKND